MDAATFLSFLAVKEETSVNSGEAFAEFGAPTRLASLVLVVSADQPTTLLRPTIDRHLSLSVSYSTHTHTFCDAQQNITMGNRGTFPLLQYSRLHKEGGVCTHLC